MPTTEHRSRRQKHFGPPALSSITQKLTLKPKSFEFEKNQETKDLVAAYKPNAAFFEAYGVEAVGTLRVCG